jgi:hypothetical protein
MEVNRLLQLKALPFRAGMVLIALQVFVLERLYGFWQ